MSKEAQRQAAARKRQRNARLAKGFVIALLVMVVTLIVLIGMQA